jgi:predicted signal transduction protein with EAL and GGDEF domain
MTGPEHTAGRFGGDEFVIILDRIADDRDAASEVAGEFAGRLRQLIRKPVELSTGKQVASASIGVSVFSGSAVKAEDVFRQAELAMYQAKGAERGTVRLFDEKMEQDFVRRVAIERELETAIDQRSLELHYQPQVDRNGRIFGAEALVRWFHDELGAIPPNDFIRIAEESGQIRNLGRWILRTALHDLKTRFSPFVDDAFTVSVNVSAFQLYDPDFKEQFSADVLASGVRPSQLIIELTESALLRTEIDIIEKMHALKAIGIRFSLDDFGTGYSSLTRLKQLPIDELKIDQSFVRDITTNDDSRAIAGSVIALARSMKIGVIAEGVESEAHRQALEDMGCDQFQGYFCGRPVATDAFIELLAGKAGNG